MEIDHTPPGISPPNSPRTLGAGDEWDSAHQSESESEGGCSPGCLYDLPSSPGRYFSDLDRTGDKVPTKTCDVPSPKRTSSVIIEKVCPRPASSEHGARRHTPSKSGKIPGKVAKQGARAKPVSSTTHLTRVATQMVPSPTDLSRKVHHPNCIFYAMSVYLTQWIVAAMFVCLNAKTQRAPVTYLPTHTVTDREPAMTAFSALLIAINNSGDTDLLMAKDIIQLIVRIDENGVLNRKKTSEAMANVPDTSIVQWSLIRKESDKFVTGTRTVVDGMKEVTKELKENGANGVSKKTAGLLLAFLSYLFVEVAVTEACPQNTGKLPQWWFARDTLKSHEVDKMKPGETRFRGGRCGGLPKNACNIAMQIGYARKYEADSGVCPPAKRQRLEAP